MGEYDRDIALKVTNAPLNNVVWTNYGQENPNAARVMHGYYE